MTPKNEHREALRRLRAIATARNLPFITVARCFLRSMFDEYKRAGSLAELQKENSERAARVYAEVKACLERRQQERRRPTRIM